MKYGIKAAELFVNGYNCAQAIAVAFCDVTGMEQATAAKLASSFGGGMGGLQEVCGAVSGMLLVAGSLFGYDVAGDDAQKKAHYQRVQALAEEFRSRIGNIICRQILQNMPSEEENDPCLAQLCKTRPCAKMVYVAAEVLDEYIRNNSKG